MRPPAVICKGRASEPHPPTEVYPRPRPGDEFVGALYECPMCRYDVSIDCELDELLPAIDLHHLAQLVTARREARNG